MTETEHKIDRTGWSAGPWDGEPDREQWKTRAGLPGLIVRGLSGALCGYVAVPPGHPLDGARAESPGVEVHGGLTYAAACEGYICHVPEPGEPDDVWWFGFDCAHSGDVRPGHETYARRLGLPPLRDGGVVYRTIGYVRAEVERLAEQLAAVPPGGAR